MTQGSTDGGFSAVQEAIAEFPGVVRSVGVIHSDSSGTERLTLYVQVADSTRVPEPSRIRSFLSHMVTASDMPDTVILVSDIPLTTSGSPDLEALPIPRRTPFGSARSVRAELLGELVGTVLGVHVVPMDESFADLGGRSLLVARLVSLIRSILPLAVNMRNVLDAESVSSLIAQLDRQGHSELRPEGAQSEDDTLSQQQVVLPGSWATGLRWAGPLNLGALDQALQDVALRHPILIPDDTLPGLSVVAVSEGDGSAQLERESVRTWDTSEGPRIRGVAIVHGPSDHSVALVVDREVIDEESLAILLDDWCHAYTARVRGHAPIWQLLPGDSWGRSQRRDLGTRESLSADDLKYWRERLARTPVQGHLSHDRPRSAQPSLRSETIVMSAPAEIHNALRQVARRHNSTLRMVLQAALACLLATNGETDIVIGTSRHGRTSESLDNFVGRLSDRLVLRFDLSRNSRFSEVITQAREVALAADERRAPLWEQIVAGIEPQLEGSALPQQLFQVALELRPGSRDRPSLPGVRVSPLSLPATFDLDVAVILAENFDGLDQPSGLLGELRYSVDVFDRLTAEWIAERYERLLRVVAVAPETLLDDLLSDSDTMP